VTRKRKRKLRGMARKCDHADCLSRRCHPEDEARQQREMKTSGAALTTSEENKINKEEEEQKNN